MKKTGQTKKTTKSPRKKACIAPAEVREIEMNARPSVLAANRVAAYTTPDTISLRFFWALYLGPTMLHPDGPMLELNNLAEISMSPVAAKRLLVDLGSAIEKFERRMGAIPTPHDLENQWLAGADAVHVSNPSGTVQ